MPIRDVFLLAIEAIYGSKLRAGLTMLGLIIGVASVVLLVSIGNGAKNYILHQFEGLGTNVILIQPGKTDAKSGFGPPLSNAKKKITLADVEALEKQSLNLEAVSGLVFGTCNIKYQDRTVNANLLGGNDQFPKIFNIPLQVGDFISHEEDETGRRVVVLGHNVALKLFDSDVALGQPVKVNEIEHRVIGVMKKAGETLGFNLDEVVFVPTKDGMRIFNEDKLFGVRAKARSRVSMDDAVSEIKEIFRSRNNGQDDITVITQTSMIDTMNTILDMLTYVLAAIAFISLLVGGIGIMNIMLVSVTERTREIGIRRAVGARKQDILRQFLVESVTLSLLGGLIGLVFSTALTYAVYLFYPKFDMRAPYWILIPAFLISTIIGVAFGVWPARKAANIETIDALRYE